MRVTLKDVAKMLIERISGNYQDCNRLVLIEPTLIIRDSTAVKQKNKRVK